MAYEADINEIDEQNYENPHFGGESNAKNSYVDRSLML